MKLCYLLDPAKFNAEAGCNTFSFLKEILVVSARKQTVSAAFLIEQLTIFRHFAVFICIIAVV